MKSEKFQGDIMKSKDRYLRISSIIIIFTLAMSFVPAVSASSPPSIPNVFEGNLLADGAKAPVGTIISAYVDSELVGWNSIKEIGKYELTVTGAEKDNGKAITFKLGNVESETTSTTYEYGASPEELDLAFKGADFTAIVLDSEEILSRYAGADKIFSAEEIKSLVNDTNISAEMKYAILKIYFADGWDKI